MNKEEIIGQAINEYEKLRRIIRAEDPRKEAEDQKRFVEAKLQAFGVVTEKLESD